MALEGRMGMRAPMGLEHGRARDKAVMHLLVAIFCSTERSCGGRSQSDATTSKSSGISIACDWTVPSGRIICNMLVSNSAVSSPASELS